MKLKIMRNTDLVDLQDRINEFIAGKKVVDMKFMESGIHQIAYILYEDK